MMREPIHPGEFVQEVLEGYEMTTSELAHALGLAEPYVAEVAASEADMTTDMALRLSRWLGQSEGFWVRLDADYRIRRTLQENASAIDAIRPREDAA